MPNVNPPADRYEALNSPEIVLGLEANDTKYEVRVTGAKAPSGLPNNWFRFAVMTDPAGGKWSGYLWKEIPRTEDGSD